MRLAIGIGAVVVITLLILMWMKRRKQNAKRKEDREQMSRKLREDALDRALSNRLHHSQSSQAQTPFEVRYNGEQGNEKNVEMLRLVEQSETITKEYLVRRDSIVYLGEEYSRPAIFYQLDRSHHIDCEIFPNDGDIYIRRCSKRGGYLVRGKKKTALDTKGIRLRSGDIVEMRCGMFLLEFL